MPRSTLVFTALISYGKSLPAPVVVIVICLSVLPIAGLVRSSRTASAKVARSAPSLARLSDAVTIKTTNAANPAVHLSDGHEILTPYSGPKELRTALEQNQAQPLSLASADFDEDGVPDLITGYSFRGRGIVTLMRGNVDAIYPNSPEAQQRRANGTFTAAPFLSPAYVFSTPVAADFIAAGDFDGDSHWDVVAASTNDAMLFLLPGNGKGEFSTVKQTALPGLVTAFAAGEINRRDGLTDIVVGIDAPAAPEVLVFEGPRGALNATPEVLPMPSRVASLALGQLDNSYETDLVAASGSELIFVHGRDRRLLAEPSERGPVEAVHLEHRSFPSAIRGLAVGDFEARQKLATAVLMDDGKVYVVDAGATAGAPLADWKVQTLERSWGDAAKIFAAKVSSLPGDELLVSDTANRSFQIVRTASKPTETSVADRGLLSTIQSVGTAPIALLPMRLNSDALSDLAIVESGNASPTIVTTAAGAIFVVNSTADTDDGQCTTAPNGCTLREAISASNANTGADTIRFAIPGTGIHTITPQSFFPNVADPVTIDATTQPDFAGQPLIQLNGINDVNDATAFDIYAGNSTLRGFVINRFHSNGLNLLERPGNIVEGNYIGTDATGTVALPNEFRGIGIGGDAGGTYATANNRIGGTTAQARNIISGNKVQGVRILNLASTGNIVQGNYIGTNVSGTASLGNHVEGILIGGALNNTIGGTEPGAGNLVSGNGLSGTGRNSAGIHITPLSPSETGATGNLVQGNRVGTNASGTAALGNAVEGVVFEDGASSNTIGGTTAAARNIVSGNGTNGVDLGFERKVTLNQVLGNYIGTDVTGELPLGNLGYGIFINVNSDNNTIRDNRIAFNGLGGIFIPNVTPDPGTPGVRITIDTNSIYANGGLGIDLGAAGITPNDFQDPDVGGNLQQNFPVLTSAVPSSSAETLWERAGEVGREMPDPALAAAALTVNGALNSTPNATFTVHWYFSADAQCTTNQAASRPLASGKVPNVMTNGNGDAQFIFTLDFPSGTTAGIVNCTATDAQGNTSEFSSCMPVTAPTAATTTISSVSGSGTYGATAMLTATLTANSTPVTGKTINLNVDGASVCGAVSQPACPQTNGSGIATLNVSGYHSGGHPVIASFAGDSSYGASNGNGTLTVSKASLTITADNKLKLIGNPNPPLTFTPTGFVNGDTANVLSGAPSLTTTATQSSPVGSYPINITQNTLTAADYSFSFVNGTLSITPLLFVETGTNNLAAIDSVSFTRGPFALTNTQNYSSDQRTRIIFFTTDLGFAQPAQPDLNTLSVQVGGNSYTVESVGPNATISGSYIVFRIPDLTVPGTYPLGIRVRGANSANTPNLQLVGSPSSPAAIPKANKVRLAQYLLSSFLDLIL